MAFEPETFQEHDGPCPQLGMGFAQRIGRQHDVFQYADPLDQVELLKDETEGAAADFGQETLRQARNIEAVFAGARKGGAYPLQQNPAGCGPRHAADQRQQRCFARAARALQDGYPTRIDPQAYLVDRRELAGETPVKAFADIGKGDHHDLMALSGSVVAASQEGTIVAATKGTTDRKNKIPS